MRVNLFIFSLLFCKIMLAQGIAIGDWREHLPHNNCNSVFEVGNRIYCVNENAVFYYDKDDNNLQRLSKINGLSDIEISTAGYSKENNSLLIAYGNANLDLIQDNVIYNISDIKRKQIVGNKSINNILIVGRFAYLSCGFGVVVLDLIDKEISETWYIGDNGTHVEVFDLTQSDNRFYAATEKGIYYADINASNFSDYNFWQKDTLINKPNGVYNAIEYCFGNIYVNKHTTYYNEDTLYYFNFSDTSWYYFDTTRTTDVRSIESIGEKLVVVFSYSVSFFDEMHVRSRSIWTYGFDNTEPSDIMYDNEDVLWIADRQSGLVRNSSLWSYEKMHPNGPEERSVSEMSIVDNKLWVATGTSNRDGVFSFIDEEWTTYNGEKTDGLDTLYNIVNIEVDPINSSIVYAGTWGFGLLKIDNGVVSKIYGPANSTISGHIVDPSSIRIGGLVFDDTGNLWVTNVNPITPMSVLLTDGQWVSFTFDANRNANNALDLIVDNNNQKWMMVSNGILVFNDNQTILDKSDDMYKVLNTEIGVGNLPSSHIYCLAKDRDGEIWVGTDKGISVFYSPENVFTDYDFDSQQILVEKDSIAQYLLEMESVTSIVVDGADKKWIGTKNAGVFYLSSDGIEELLHFTEENSPLFSGSIIDIEVDNESGEVFFATSKGILSYKNVATEGVTTIIESNVVVYPNPVRENYDGYIAIKGLVTDSDVKISDISGNLVHSTIAEGGQAVWDGRNIYGEKVHSGVYLIFSSNIDGAETIVAKVLIIN